METVHQRQQTALDIDKLRVGVGVVAHFPFDGVHRIE